VDTPADEDDVFLKKAAKALQKLLDQPEDEPGETVGSLLRTHLGTEDLLPVFSEDLGGWELANVQLALDALLARPGWSGRILGVGGQGRHFSGLGLSDFLSVSGHPWPVGPTEYVNVPVGPDETLPCLEFAVVLVSRPDGPLGLFVHRGSEHGPSAGLSVQAAAAGAGAARAFLADLRAEMGRVDVHRGKVITVGQTPHGGAQVEFLQRPSMEPGELVLPDGALDRIERHVLGPTRHRDALLAGGRHLGRGLLLWGPPGTGKTHTVRYLMGRLTDATVIVLSGGSLYGVGAFGGLARRLAPSVVVLEDVDLVADERSFDMFGGGGGPVLFDLMNEMSGIGQDADVAFVLTTNRPDVLEPALAMRPGRVDLAIEIPLPDDAARARLLDLYARGLDARIDDPATIVARTEGMTASFFKELLRSAALAAAEDGRTGVTDADMAKVLDELLSQGAALTRVLLGARRDRGEDGELPGHLGWLEEPPEIEGPG
jgi:ATPase family associated with various cellular activities (AAA)